MGEQRWHVQPKAVLMTFQSVADKDVQDVFYYNCPRERIFDFQNFTTSTGWEIENPVSNGFGEVTCILLAPGLNYNSLVPNL